MPIGARWMDRANASDLCSEVRLARRIAGGDPLTGLLSAVQAVVPGRRQPIGQDREGLPARLTDSAPHPDAFVLVIVA